VARRLVSQKAVREIRIENARELITTTPNAHEEILEHATDAIVRLKTQHNDSDVEVRAAHEALSSVAAKVIVQRAPKPKSPVLETKSSITARQAVLELTEESSFHDKPKLRDLLERIMSECGI